MVSLIHPRRVYDFAITRPGVNGRPRPGRPSSLAVFWDVDAPATLEEMRNADSLDEFAARPRAPGAGADA